MTLPMLAIWTFLTMYRANSKCHLLYDHASSIVNGPLVHSHGRPESEFTCTK
jgi:hypothetical protein